MWSLFGKKTTNPYVGGVLREFLKIGQLALTVHRVLANKVFKTVIDAYGEKINTGFSLYVIYPSLKGGACRRAGPGGDQPQPGTQSA
jgi:hypothetical protein